MKPKWVLLILAVFITIILYNVNPNENMFVPDEIVGRWETDSPKYQERYLELSSVSVVYGTGEDTIDVNFVQSIKKQAVGGNASYTINYRNCEGEEGNISFLWDSAKKEIRMKNQNDIAWKMTAVPFKG